jgi:hypothetical protein
MIDVVTIKRKHFDPTFSWINIGGGRRARKV